MKIGKEIAKNQQSELTILGKDGKFKIKTAMEMTRFHHEIKKIIHEKLHFTQQ